MLSYVKDIQRVEREETITTLKHQEWSGAYMCDLQLETIKNNLNSTLSLSDGITESQFL